MNVSAVVPVYNAATTLERAINSLLIQPEINEIFIVDDGSTDGSYGLVLDIERRYDLVTVLTHPNHSNRGASASRNLGLKFCTNEWIQFLDADDELLEFKVSSQLNLINNNTHLVVGSSYVHSKNRIIRRSPLTEPYSGVLCGKLGDTCSNLWNRFTINKVGGWNELLINTQEYDLMFRILKEFPNVQYSFIPLTNIYYQASSITFSSFFKFEKSENQIMLKNSIRDFLIKHNKFTIKREFFYSIGICNFKRFHNTQLLTYEKSYYYFIYKSIKFFSDRLIR